MILLEVFYSNFSFIHISAVPRDMRKHLHDSVVQELSNLRAWLEKNANRNAQGGLSYQIGWDEERDALLTIVPHSPETERL